MREQAGLTNEEIYGIQQLATLNNTTLDKTNEKLLGAAKIYAGRNKIAINEKQILKDVSKASDALKLSLGGGADKLAEAAVKARQFGLSLEQTEKMAESLLNFESSIESELSAELLTGKDLNLEKARSLALSGDTAAAAAEMAKQMGSAAEFGKMNVIQQEALAKSVGMNRDELAKSLLDKEALVKLGVTDAKNGQEAYNKLRAQGLSEAQIAAKLGSDEQARMFEQQSIQERFNQTVEKLKEIFITVGNALMPIFDIFSGIFDVVGPIVGMIGKVVSFMSPILKPMLLIWGAFKGIKLATQGITSLNKTLIAQNAVKTAQAEAQVTAETTKLSLGQRILGVLGLQTAANRFQVVMANELGVAAALRAAMEETILGSFILQGASLLRNVGAYILTNIQATSRAFIENTILGTLIAQAAAWAVANPFKALAGLAVAGVVTAGISSIVKGNDVFSPAQGGSGYGKRTLLAPEGAIQLNDKDNIIATTNPVKADDLMSAPKGTIQVSNKTAPKKEEKIQKVNTYVSLEMSGQKLGQAVHQDQYSIR
jgi:hypothetical protein